MLVQKPYTPEVLKLMEYAESKDDPMVQAVRTHVPNMHSTLLQTVNNFKKSFQRQSKQNT
jgi:hypothetical protein